MSVTVTLDREEWALLVLTLEVSGRVVLQASQGGGGGPLSAEVVSKVTRLREKLESVLLEGAGSAG